MNHSHHTLTLDDSWRLAGHPPSLPFIPLPLLSTFPLLSPSFPQEHSFLLSRGISLPAYRAFHLRVFPQEHSVVFPYTNILGNVIGLTFRSTVEKKFYGRRIDNVDLPKKGVLGAFFGMERIDITKPVLILEAELDCILAYSYGFTNVLSSGGMGMTRAQAKAIYNRDILLGYDADPAGDLGYNKVSRLLRGKKIYRVDWSPYKDLGEIRDKKIFLEKIEKGLTG